MLVKRHLSSFRHFGETRETTGSAQACRPKAPGVSPQSGDAHPHTLPSPTKPRTVLLNYSETGRSREKLYLAIIVTGSRPAAFTDLGYFQQKHKSITLLLRGALHYRRTRAKRRTFAGVIKETFLTNQTIKDSNRDFSNKHSQVVYFNVNSWTLSADDKRKVG